MTGVGGNRFGAWQTCGAWQVWVVMGLNLGSRCGLRQVWDGTMCYMIFMGYSRCGVWQMWSMESVECGRRGVGCDRCVA